MPLLFLMLLAQTNGWVIRDTEIYQNLGKNQIAFAHEHGWFLLNSEYQTIRHYSKHGKFIRTIARRGSGPGELNQTNIVRFTNGRLFTSSPNKIKIFSSDGTPITQVKRREIFLWMEKSHLGWVGYPHALNRRDPAAIVVYDDLLKAGSTLTQWTIHMPNKNIAKKDGKFIFPRANDRFTLALDSARSVVYLRKPGTSRIECWDLTRKTLAHQFPLANRLDVKANKELYKTYIANNPGRTPNGGYFPKLELSPHGDLYFYPIAAIDKPQVYSPTGQPKKTVFTIEEIKRIVHTTPTHHVVIFKDAESEMFQLAQITRATLKSFIAAHPMAPEDL